MPASTRTKPAFTVSGRSAPVAGRIGIAVVAVDTVPRGGAELDEARTVSLSGRQQHGGQ